jgi:hypothetical protein
MTNMSSLKYIKLLHYKVNGRTFPISFRADFKFRQPVLCNLLHDPKKGCGIQCVRKPVVLYIIRCITFARRKVLRLRAAFTGRITGKYR